MGRDGCREAAELIVNGHCGARGRIGVVVARRVKPKRHNNRQTNAAAADAAEVRAPPKLMRGSEDAVNHQCRAVPIGYSLRNPSAAAAEGRSSRGTTESGAIGSRHEGGNGAGGPLGTGAADTDAAAKNSGAKHRATIRHQRRVSLHNCWCVGACSHPHTRSYTNAASCRNPSNAARKAIRRANRRCIGR